MNRSRLDSEKVFMDMWGNKGPFVNSTYTQQQREATVDEEIAAPNISETTSAMRAIAYSITGGGQWMKADWTYYYKPIDREQEIKNTALSKHGVWLSTEQARKLARFCDRLCNTRDITQQEFKELEE